VLHEGLGNCVWIHLLSSSYDDPFSLLRRAFRVERESERVR
jgi:hypothetical protein